MARAPPGVRSAELPALYGARPLYHPAFYAELENAVEMFMLKSLGAFSWLLSASSWVHGGHLCHAQAVRASWGATWCVEKTRDVMGRFCLEITSWNRSTGRRTGWHSCDYTHYCTNEGLELIKLREYLLAILGMAAPRPQGRREPRVEEWWAEALPPWLQFTSLQLVSEVPPAQRDSIFNPIMIIVSSPYVTLSYQDSLLTACWD